MAGARLRRTCGVLVALSTVALGLAIVPMPSAAAATTLPDQDVLVRTETGLVRIAADGTTSQVTSGVQVMSGSVDPTGTTAVFWGSDGQQDIFRVNLDGSGLSRLTNDTDPDSFPSFSPDGSKVLFNRYLASGSDEIFTMNADGTGLVRLTTSTGFDSEARFSPDGTKIVFRSQRSSNSGDIWVMNADGSNPVQLTSDAAADAYPDWSPDGTRIAFMSTRSGSGQIYVMAADGTNVVAVTSSGSNTHPSWSVDGSVIAYSGDGDLRAVTPDGTQRWQMTATPGVTEWYPDWIPGTGGGGPSAWTVHVTTSGSGTGTVTSDPAGIACPPTCSATFGDGEAVTLSALADSGSTFTGFSGACTGSAPCSLTVTGDREVDAAFAPAPAAQPPDAVDDAYTVAAGATLDVPPPGVLGNDSDPEGGPLTARITESPAHGSITLSGDGSFSYTPDAGYTGTDGFRYEATDAQALTDGALVSLSVTSPPPSDAVVWAAPPNGGLWVGGVGAVPTQVVTGDAWTPSWSPDRSRIAFASSRDGMPDLWLVDADGTGLVKLTNDAAADSAPAWSPDGSRIAFASDRDGDSEIWTVDIGGGSLRQLTFDPGHDSDPAWSPSGDRLAYRSDAGISIVTADGSVPTTLVARSSRVLEAPDWSPDGSQVAFTALEPGQPAQIHVVDVDGTDERTVPLEFHAADPSWSPDGTHLAFMAYVNGETDVWVSGVDGDDPVNISDRAGIDNAPDWGLPPTPPPLPSDLETSATPGADAVVAGSNLTVTGTARNGGTVPATGTVLELEAVGGTLASVVGKNCTITSPTTASCRFGDVAAGKSLGYRATLHAGPVGTLALTVRLRCSCGEPPDVRTVRRPIVPTIADGSLGVVVSGPDAATQGDPLQYRFTVTNRTPVTATNVRLKLQAQLGPGVGLAITDARTPSGPCATTTSCALGGLAAGASVDVTMSVADSGGASPTVAGGVACDCTNGDSSDDVVVMRTHVTPRLDLAMAITNPSSVRPGAPIVWTGTVGGIGSNVVSDLVVEFVVPEGVTVSQATTESIGGVPQGQCTVTGQRVRCRYPSATGTPRISIVGTPMRGGTYQLTGTILGGGFVDPNGANNTVTGPPVRCPHIADLAITKRSTQTRASVGDTVSWVITAQNRGPDDASTVRVVDNLPNGFSFVAASGAPRPCTANRRTVTCALGTVAAGVTYTITIQARAVTQTTSAVNSAQIACDCWEPSSSPPNAAVADPVRVWPVVRPVTATPCAAFTPVGSCVLELYVNNDNPFTIPGGVIEIGPLDPTSGPRLDGAVPLPGSQSCTDLGTVIRCTLGGIPAGGRRVIVPLLPSSSTPFTLQVRWDCGCTDQGWMVTSLPPIAPTETCIGGQVLFDSDATRDRDIYAARLDGSGWTNLTDNVGVEEMGAVWAPDSSRFVFSRGRPGARQLWIAALDGFGCIRAQWPVPGQPRADNYQPDWAPVGGRLAFISDVTGNHDIWVIRIDGAGLTRVTTAAKADRAPSFSQDGTRIAFASQRDDRGRNASWNIFTTNADGSGRETFLSTSAPGYDGTQTDYSPTFSRGSGPTRILWHSSSGGNYDLWVMNEDGSGKRRVPNASSLAEKNGDWSADGTKVVYDAGTGTAGIWIMDADGSNRRRVATTGGIDQAPSMHTATLPPRPCGAATASGGAGTTTTVYQLGVSNGSFRLTWDAFSIPDQFDVLYQGREIYTTGTHVSGVGDVVIPFSGTDTHVTVRVSGPEGTEWNYTVHCP